MTRMYSVGLTQISAVLAWHDRNPISQNQRYYSALNEGPHSVTTRWSYTVPTGKYAFLTMARAAYVRTGAPTTASYVLDDIVIAGGIHLSASGIPANVDSGRESIVGYGSLLKAGELILGRTSDASTGGTAYHQLSAQITEFNA